MCRAFLLIGLFAMLASCAVPSADNPYPGSGGSQFRDPTAEDIADTRLQFDLEKLNAFRIGTSTKRDVVAQLGEPTWWETGDNGYSRLGYDFHQKGGTVNDPYLAPATFVFDANNILVDADYAESYKTIHVERRPETYAYVEALVGKQIELLSGIVPADSVDPSGKTMFLGGYIRVPVHVFHVVAGEIPNRHLVLVFTIGDLFVPPWRGYFLLETDRFGTTRVVDWDRRPSLCEIDAAEVRDPERRAFVNVVKSSPTCAAELSPSR